MRDVERFIEECRIAARDGQKSVREVLREAMRDPAGIVAMLGAPREAASADLYCGPDLTIINVVWAPLMTIHPHDHGLWAAIGLYGGGEDNIFWRRTPDGIEAAGAQALRTGEVATFGPDIVHSVTNPVDRFSGAIHVYGGDFHAMRRTEWDPDTLTEAPHDPGRLDRVFAEANGRYRAASGEPR
jgi:predicted metal-dependent enzyme (double-stranded beta helix superfamily)